MDTQKAVCAQEAMELLNCVAGPEFDQQKCLRLLQSLRECVLNKKVKKFSLADQTTSKEADLVVKKQS